MNPRSELNKQSIFNNICIFLSYVHCMHIQLCLTLCDPTDCSPPGSSIHGLLQGKYTGVGCHFLLQRIFPIEGLSPRLLHLLHWQADSLPLVPPGKPWPFTWYTVIPRVQPASLWCQDVADNFHIFQVGNWKRRWSLEHSALFRWLGGRGRTRQSAFMA